MIVYLRLTHSLIYEKEKKLREGMKMMGLSNWSFYAAWIIQYALIYGIICILGTAILSNKIINLRKRGVCQLQLGSVVPELLALLHGSACTIFVSVSLLHKLLTWTDNSYRVLLTPAASIKHCRARHHP